MVLYLAVQLRVTNVLKLVPQEFNLNEAYLYAPLEEVNVSDTNLSESNIVVRKSYDVTIANNGLNQTLETDVSMTLEPFDEEDYNLTYTSTGNVESLDNSKLTVNGRTITLQDLSVASGSARLTVTFKKKDLTPKSKVYNRNVVLIVDKSSKEGSGTATTSSKMVLLLVKYLELEFKTNKFVSMYQMFRMFLLYLSLMMK